MTGNKAKKKKTRVILLSVVAVILGIFSCSILLGADISIPKVGIEITPAKTPKDVAATIQILLLLTILTLAPAILVLMTSFTRIIIVLSFLRQALGSQQIPPNQILIGLALFMTFYLMSPVGVQIYDKAWTPYLNNEITFEHYVKNDLKT